MRVLKDNSQILIVDLEATCWLDKEYQQAHSEILEIGIVSLDLYTRTITDKATYLIQTKSKVSDYCTSLTNITQEMVDKDGMSLQKASKLIRTRFKTTNKAWAGWGDDYNHLKEDCENKNAVFPFSDNYHNVGQFYCWKMGLKRGIKLEKAMLSLGLSFEGIPHRALIDAENTASLFLKIFEQNPSK